MKRTLLALLALCTLCFAGCGADIDGTAKELVVKLVKQAGYKKAKCVKIADREKTGENKWKAVAVVSYEENGDEKEEEIKITMRKKGDELHVWLDPFFLAKSLLAKTLEENTSLTNVKCTKITDKKQFGDDEWKAQGHFTCKGPDGEKLKGSVWFGMERSGDNLEVRAELSTLADED